MPGTTTSSPASRRRWRGRQRCRGATRRGCPPPAATCTRRMRPASSYARDHGFLTYDPCFHPWSIYRVDKGAAQIDLLLQHARRAGLTLASCIDVYRHLVAQPQLAHPAPKLPSAASA